MVSCFPWSYGDIYHSALTKNFFSFLGVGWRGEGTYFRQDDSLTKAISGIN